MRSERRHDDGNDEGQSDVSRIFSELFLRHTIGDTREEQEWEIVPKGSKSRGRIAASPEGSLYMQDPDFPRQRQFRVRRISPFG